MIVSSDITVSVTNLGKLWTQHDLKQRVLAMRCKSVILLPKSTRDVVLQSIMVLLVSTNENETLATRSYLQPLDGHATIYSFNQDGEQVIYYIGKYGACPAAVKVVPGDFEVDGSARTISTPTDQCFPNLCATVSVRVACGIKGKVKMCDVLVSSQIVNYDKVPDGQIYLPREKSFTVSPWLKKLFTQPVHWPDYTIKACLINNDMSIPNVMSGMILSGPTYDLDDPAMNDFVSNFAGEAIGIEMQRAHYFTTNTVNVIIVKAVCNLGDGNNNQPTAALLAADLVYACLSDTQASEELAGLHNVAS